MEETIEVARRIASRVWCDAEMEDKTMHTGAAEAIAQIVCMVLEMPEPSSGTFGKPAE